MIVFFVKGAVLIALILLIFSPKLVFTYLDEYLFKEEPRDNTVYHLDTTAQIQLDPVGLDLEEDRLHRIQKMIDSSTSDEIRRIWELKKAEFLRNTRWNRLVEFAGASQRS